MCSRYVLASGVKAIERELLAEFETEFTPFFNGHPGGAWPVVLSSSSTTVSFAKWGLVPYWSRWYSGSYHYNAFYTDLVRHPVYKIPIRQRRCLIPANCYYIWAKDGGKKKPYVVYIERHKVFTMAGVYDIWKDRQTNEFHCTYAVISTFSCKRLSRFSPAMPVIISPSRRSRFLKEEISLREVMQMMRPFESNLLNLYPVSDSVDDPTINDKQIVQPIGDRVYPEINFITKSRYSF